MSINNDTNDKINVEINGQKTQVTKGDTILKAAHNLNIDIPTLCNPDNKEFSQHHNSSCSLCLVKVQGQDQLVTACDTIIEQPLEVITETDEINAARQKSLELLMSEHLGDCVASCVLSCPHKLDIPFLLKLVYTSTFTTSSEAVIPESFLPLTLNSKFVCIDCAAPCQKSCRRTQIDKTLPIQSIFISCFQQSLKYRQTQPELETELPSGLDNSTINTKENKKDTPGREQRKLIVDTKLFKSVLSRLRNDAEQQIFLQQSLEVQIPESPGMIPDAGKCLQCSCSKQYSCELRNECSDYKVRAGHFKVGKRQDLKAQQLLGYLRIDSGKCISCGKCQYLAKQLNLPFSPLFWYRGYDNRIVFPEAAIDLDAETAGKFVDICPSAAISMRK